MTASVVTKGPGGRRIKVTVLTTDTPTPILLTDFPTYPYYPSDYVVVAATPSGGGSMLVEATWSLESDVTGGTANWFAWNAGSVSSPTNAQLLKPTAVRFTATTATGVGEIAR
jgi:hypothetical protein